MVIQPVGVSLPFLTVLAQGGFVAVLFTLILSAAHNSPQLLLPRFEVPEQDGF